jgi:exopolysaccharide production protein ExoY
MTVHFDKLNNDLNSASSPFGVIVGSRRRGLYRNLLKRVVDVSIILAATPFVLPVVAVLAIGVARDGSAPIYRSSRVGKGGKNFRMLKLRTMVPDADGLLDEHLAANDDAQEEWNTTQKLKNDPRVTKFGLFLRKTSLDELPQLWNVLAGDMSLVGPRPMLPAQRALYPGLSYYDLRPGITGPWQVSERNDSEFVKRADHDREYDEEMSFFADLRYLVRTVSVVLKGTGY